MKDELVYLKHIMECIGRIESFMKGITKSKFLKDELIQSAVIRQIEVIGEAVKNLPLNFTSKYTAVPWKEIAGTRDKMVHHYFGVDLEFIFDIVKKDIPKLKKQIREIMDNWGKEDKE
ncbi:MAG: DUF86 domain-containing protein [Nanoarchaeota archaeon]|nr:DUF86 domain-containing protein [Nanoarchaeota archaeon]